MAKIKKCKPGYRKSGNKCVRKSSDYETPEFKEIKTILGRLRKRRILLI